MRQAVLCQKGSADSGPLSKREHGFRDLRGREFQDSFERDSERGLRQGGVPTSVRGRVSSACRVGVVCTGGRCPGAVHVAGWARSCSELLGVFLSRADKSSFARVSTGFAVSGLSSRLRAERGGVCRAGFQFISCMFLHESLF